MKLSLFGKASHSSSAPDPKESAREWNRRLRSEMRGVDRQVRRINIEEAKVANEIKLAAKRGDQVSLKILAKEIVRSRRAKSRLNESKAHMNSISMQLQHNVATLKLTDNMKSSTEVMHAMNKLVKLPEVAETMAEMSKEMAKMGLIEEMVGDAVDALDGAGMEEETEEEVAKVMDELAAGVLAQLPSGGQALAGGQSVASSASAGRVQATGS